MIQVRHSSSLSFITATLLNVSFTNIIVPGVPVPEPMIVAVTSEQDFNKQPVAVYSQV